MADKTKVEYDFGGFATRANILCSDGRRIMKDAFKDNCGKKVPLVWQHCHDDPTNVLGHAYLEDREGDVYAWCVFNSTPGGTSGKGLVEHGDVEALSIFANQLIEKNKIVHSGNIREVSLVLAGANPGAKIDYINLSHGDETVVSDDEAIIYMDDKELSISHAEDEESAGGNETVEEVLDTLNEKQKTVVMALLATVMEDGEESVEQSAMDNSNSQGDKEMKKNVFDKEEEKAAPTHLTHAQFSEIIADAKKTGSFKESFLQHVVTYGIENIDYLFPDAKTLEGPAFVKRDMGWVPTFFGATRKSPFSRIKSMSADITLDDARARGYVKGELKKEEFFAMSRRTTGPTTVYKKQKLDRDDITDITDMDVVSWLKSEMRMMLDEEIARAGLIGDGRAAEAEGKIDETCIRPIWKDATLYVHKLELDSDATALETIDAIAAARKEYKGTGSPKMFCTPDFLSSLLLIRDTLDHRLYRTVAELAAELRVSDIVEVPVMVGVERTVDSSPDYDVDLRAIIVNPVDYVFGADKGGNVSMFDDFDIDYNQYKYLIETRCSGCLILPKSAIIVEQKQSGGN